MRQVFLAIHEHTKRLGKQFNPVSQTRSWGAEVSLSIHDRPGGRRMNQFRVNSAYKSLQQCAVPNNLRAILKQEVDVQSEK